ncbi:MAK10-like protein [Tanacetum coccineum]|uniref:MAK10-like protein n=1 Tax=Tanacetum coccineum TaxID=301880 RepID=A0ABQ5BNA5_9ASTR
MKAIGIPSSSLWGTTWYLFDPTPSDWCKTDAHSTDFGSEDPNQHLKDFLKLVDSVDLDCENRERTRLRLFQFSLRDQASNWLERLLAGSITTWEDLTTRFLAQFFPPRRTAKLRNDILMFQQHHGESLSEAWTRFKDLLQKVPHHGIDLWLQVQIFYDHVNPVTRRTIDQSAGGKLRDRNAKESWALLEDLALYDNESWNDPRDFAKPVKAITLPQDVPSTSDRRLIELENQVQRLMEAHLAPMQPTQVNKITTSCEICSGPHDTQYCMEDPEQAFVEYASSRTDEAGEGLVSNFMASQHARLSKFEADFKQQQSEMANKIDTVLKAITDRIAGTLPSDTVKNPKLSTSLVLSARSYPTIDCQTLKGLVSNFMASQHARLSKFEADFKQQQSKMANKINTVLKAITGRIAGTLPSDTVKNPKLSTSLVLSARSYPTIDCQCSSHPSTLINSIKACSTEANISQTSQLKLDPRENANGGVSNFIGRIKGMHVFVGNFTYIVDFMIIEDISSIIDPRMSQVMLGKPLVEISNMTHDPQEGVVRFTNRNDEVAYKLQYKIEQYNSLSNLEKEHTKSVYLRNEEDKRRGVEYVMSKILGFYKECLELRPEYLTGMDDEGEVT